MRHKLAISSTVELPFGKGKHFLSGAGAPVQWLAGGWQVNTIGTFQSGLPFTPTMQTNNLNTGTGSQFPNRIASGVLPSDQRSIDRWFDASAFVAPGQYIFGNAGRNILYGPGTQQVDVSLFKNFVFPEEPPARGPGGGVQRLQHAAVQQSEREHRIRRGGKITTAGSPTVYQRTSRQVQLALKLYF